MDSSKAEVCSGDVPCFEGREAARSSFSTYRESELAGGRERRLRRGVCAEQKGKGAWRTAISKSTILSVNVLISLLKQKRYSPSCLAVKTESNCRSLVFSMINLSSGPWTV